LKPSDEMTFMVLVTPVGDYYKDKALAAYMVGDFDRAAPLGMGTYKVAGNYASALQSSCQAKAQGYPITLFLDPMEHKYVEEFATSNFVGITQDGTLVTPKSNCILRSITRLSLFELAEKKLGWKVEERKVPWEEVEQGGFKEVAACGTAVVVTAIGRIRNGEKDVVVGNGETGEGVRKLYEELKGIQLGEKEDKFEWMYPKEGI